MANIVTAALAYSHTHKRIQIFIYVYVCTYILIYEDLYAVIESKVWVYKCQLVHAIMCMVYMYMYGGCTLTLVGHTFDQYTLYQA